MELVEHNISGVKLEKLRQDARKKKKILFRFFPVMFAVLVGISVWRYRRLLFYFIQYGWENGITQGACFLLLASLMMSAILTAVAFLFYLILVYKKAYDRFNFSFKNRFVLDTVRQIPGFSQLRYDAGGGLSHEEVSRMNLIMEGQSMFFQSSDALSGVLDGVHFYACNVKTARKAKGRRSLPDTLFEGQILMFSTFDERKISKGFVQVFPKKKLKQIKPKAAPLRIETENSAFHQSFAVFAEDAENAFYILTPRVMEHIVKFQEAMEGPVYLSFVGSNLYVTCDQMKNPFDAYLEMPIEQQRQQIVEDTEILKRARDILIQLSEHPVEA